MLVTRCKNSRKIIGRLTCVLAGILSSFVNAFTLGDINLESALNEPLSANIELLELDGLDESQILVSLGSQADFERVGVEPLPLLNELQFDVEVLSSSEGRVRITSNDAIVEPYLNFVLNVRWPSGRVIREYTVLLDLPTFSANPTPAPAPRPARTAPAVVPEPAPAPQPEPQIAEAPVEVEPAPAPQPAPEPEFSDDDGDNTVVIQPGDTLWNIALATRPDNGVSVQQMMVALQRANANTDAFIGNNINGIRAGRVLRIPSRQEINAIGQDQALNQVAIQNQQFSGAQPLAVNNTQGGINPARDELSIITDTGAEDAGQADGQEIAGLNETIQALENELALSEENLDRALLENEELQSRLSDLEEQIGILENIIAIEDERMADLQQQLGEQGAGEATEVLAIGDPEPAPVQPQQQPPAQPAAPVQPPANVSIVDRITGFLGSTSGMIAALVVLLALVVGFLVARNRSASHDEDDFDSMLDESEESGFSPVVDSGSGVDDEAAEAAGASSYDDLQADSDEEDEAQGTADFEADDADIEEEDEDLEETLDQGGEGGEIDEEDDSETEGGTKAGFLAGLLARFRRDKDQSEEDQEEDGDEEDFLDENDEFEDELSDEDSVARNDGGAEEDLETDEDLEDVNILADEEEEDSFDVEDFDFDDELEESLDIEPSEDNKTSESEESEDESKDAPEASMESGDLTETDTEEDEADSEIDLTDIGELTDESAGEESDQPAEIDEETAEADTEAEKDDDDLIVFDLDESSAPASEEAADQAESAEKVKDTSMSDAEEVFEFSLDDDSLQADNAESEDTSEPDAQQEDENVETFEFKISDDESATEEPAKAGAEEQAEDLETFDFGDFTSGDENTEQNAQDSQEESVEELADEPADEKDELLLSETEEQPEEEIEAEGEGEAEETNRDESADDLEIEFLDDDSAEQEDAARQAENATGTEQNKDSNSLGNLGLDESFMNDDDDEEELEVITDQDEVATKLDLAVAYQAMEDLEGAREILNEVIAEGNEEQIAEANKLLNEWGLK